MIEGFLFIIVIVLLSMAGWLFPLLWGAAAIFAVIAVVVFAKNIWDATEEPSNDGRPPKD